MNIRESDIKESDHIEDILKYPDLEKFIIYIDFDNTLVKPNKRHKDHIGRFKHLGCDAWFAYVLALATTTLDDNILLAFAITTNINDTVQNHIHLKPAEKKTIAVINELQTKNVPVVVVTARGMTLAKRTKEQLAEANISINNESLKDHNQNGPVELQLDYNFYCFANQPEKFNSLGFKFSYVYIEETNQLFYFNRFRRARQIDIKNPEFKNILNVRREKAALKNQQKISKEEVIALIGDSHQPEPHIVVYDKNVLYCEGQNKGDAIEKFLRWVNHDKKLNKPHALMVDDKKNNVEDVEIVLNQLEINFFGMHYKRVKENFDSALSRQELKNLYFHLPVKIRAAMIEIKLSENAIGFFSQNRKMNKTNDQELLDPNDIKTSVLQP